MLASIIDQVDEVRICLNEFDAVPDWLIGMDKVMAGMPDRNLTDNGKFLALQQLVEPEYFFTMDDDLVYPPDYVDKTVERIERYGCIITYHGRLLLGKDIQYYSGHHFHHCLKAQEGDHYIDVCGTGVTAFRTDYFCPSDIAYHENQRMTDLVFSLEAAQQKKLIGICERPNLWLKPLEVKDSIFHHFQRNPKETQKKIANEIFEIKYNNPATQ
jgi:hypothetical protein